MAPPSHPHFAEVQRRWADNNPGLDVSPMEIVALLKRATALLNSAVEPLYVGGALTAPELDLLIPLRYATEPVIARHISADMGLSQAAVSKALAKLEKRGLVERTPNPADRRAALVTITPLGKEAVDSLFPRQLALESAMFADLEEKRATVISALESLVTAMERHTT
ncbi:MarR family winged helix-turn-helix transcriptional regulator [Streptomyces sp. NPDC087440]|uniref:MarR family winged helix-turn-helix transcriptional regulator n=1 Tax=Streptomyces sp. NPDC087440 TaxID=3365790 RepID=UPI0037FCE86C